MEATMKDTNNQSPKVYKRSSASKEELKQYAEGAIDKPEGIDIIKICQVTDHFFRVNYFIKKKIDNHVMYTYDMVKSKMIEIVETANGFDLIDHTDKDGGLTGDG